MVDIKFDILMNSSPDIKRQEKRKGATRDRMEDFPEGFLQEAGNLREAIREHLKRQSIDLEESIKKIKK